MIDKSTSNYWPVGLLVDAYGKNLRPGMSHVDVAKHILAMIERLKPNEETVTIFGYGFKSLLDVKDLKFYIESLTPAK